MLNLIKMLLVSAVAGLIGYGITLAKGQPQEIAVLAGIAAAALMFLLLELLKFRDPNVP